MKNKTDNTTRYDWDKMGDTVLDMAKQLSVNEIANITNIPQQTIRYFLKKNKADVKTRTYKRVNWDSIKEDLRKDLSTMCAGDVAIKYGINYNTLLAYAVKHNLPRGVKKKRDPMLNLEQHTKVKELYEEGVTPSDIAERLGFKERAVNDAINNMYRSAGDAISKADRVYSSEFRRHIGVWLDKVFNEGEIVVQSEKRGEAVVMTAARYNNLMRDAQAYRALPKKERKD